LQAADIPTKRTDDPSGQHTVRLLRCFLAGAPHLDLRFTTLDA